MEVQHDSAQLKDTSEIVPERKVSHKRTLSSHVLESMRKMSADCRRRRLNHFLKLFSLESMTSILDVGGGGDWDWSAMGVMPSITILNLDVVSSSDGKITYMQGDARNMQAVRDHEFDIAFSNSVIEHVGTFEEQKRMADEVRRTSRAYWVQTPYRHFPIEPHMMFPFFQYFPLKMRKVIGRYWPFSFEKLRKGDPERDAVDVCLLTKRQMELLFPEAEILKEKFCGMTKSLIAVYNPDR